MLCETKKGPVGPKHHTEPFRGQLTIRNIHASEQRATVIENFPQKFPVEISASKKRWLMRGEFCDTISGMGLDQANEPWVTDVPQGTIDDVIQLLLKAELIEDLGSKTARQRWKKPLTFALMHGIRTEAINIAALKILVSEARRILKGAKPMKADELRASVLSTFIQDSTANEDSKEF